MFGTGTAWLAVMKMRLARAIGLGVGLLVHTAASVARTGELTVPPGGMRTMGGVYLWADELVFHDWRIQRHGVTGHFRLLDGQYRRRAWGDFATCRAELEALKRQHALPPMRGRAILVLHGLGASRLWMDNLSRYLREQTGHHVFCLSYPSTLGEIGDHAKTLARVVDNLEGIDQIDLVAHSMGNLVIRHYLGDQLAANGKVDPRLRRMVMIAPPNHGAVYAEKLSDNPLFLTLFGPAGRQLGKGWPHLEPRLAVPEFPFGIIAGGRGDQRGYSPLLPGDDDGWIDVETTRLAGAQDFMQVEALHPALPRHPQVKECVLRFLQHGYFLSPNERQPIEPR